MEDREALRSLREDYSDEIPEEIISGEVKYKVQRNWWQFLFSYLYLGIKRGAIPKEFHKEVNTFIENYSTPKFTEKLRTEKSDIEKANNLLDKILGRK